MQISEMSTAISEIAFDGFRQTYAIIERFLLGN